MLKRLVSLMSVLLGLFSLQAFACQKLTVNDDAPTFALKDEKGKVRTLQEFKGTRVVLYFYPKDGTSGCTAQACGLRDHFSEYRKNNIVVIGINYDSSQAHADFKLKNNLPDDFILLTDADKSVAKKYGAYSGFFKWFVPARITFLINEKGKIIHCMKNISIKTHASDIVKFFNHQA